ncbi:hypothetical protein AVEN_63762-1 [Araneus ventricosus]|uniref:Uncharacterized protein n=1 Tax=Araneus ventricosus TaxID=182803 RepID=A0A4Y2GZY0_ARAVE|nr:hypothetical protein AVEN_63762-1 [Araneus ventricosus]
MRAVLVWTSYFWAFVKPYPNRHLTNFHAFPQFLKQRLCHQFNSVILTFCFEPTRAVFWDEPRHFEPQSDDEDDTSTGAPSPYFRATPVGGGLTCTYNLTCNSPYTRRIFSTIGFRT